MILPGQTFYFHEGMMHEVHVPTGEKSVTISLRPDTVYPIVAVKDDLCKAAGSSDAYTLAPEDSHWDKFRAKVFNPTHFASTLDDPEQRKKMPSRLKEAFLSALKSKTSKLEKQLPDFLDLWWADFAIRRNHCPTGGLPVPPSNRDEIYKQWEAERLQQRRPRKETA